MNKLIYITIFILSHSLLFSQKEDHIWISNFWSADNCETSDFSEYCGASILDFNQLPPKVYRGEGMVLDFSESNTSLCNSEGELILYSNGQSIHDTTNRWIDGGKRINDSPKWDWLTWENEFGVSQPTGLRSAGGVGFIPIPEIIDEYWFMYHNSEEYETTHYRELWTSKVIKDEDGEFKVTLKDSLINDKIFRAGDITACKHANGRDWWMLQFNKDTVYTYLIDPLGIHMDHIQILPFELRKWCFGQSKFSPEGDQFALVGIVDFYIPGGNDFFHSQFDRCSGNLINPKYQSFIGASTFSPGLEFSPDGKLIYLSDAKHIIQGSIDLNYNLSDFTQVAEIDSFICPVFNSQLVRFGQLQLGPDLKIYVNASVQCNYMHRIEFPNIAGEECLVNQRAIEFPSHIFGTIPSFNSRRLGPLDGSSCDTLGLDNLPISRFWYEQDAIDFLKIKFWDVSYFRPEVWEWDFGDGNSTTEQSPTHQYTEKGSYDVCLTVSNENDSHTSCQNITIGTSSNVKTEKEYSISLYPNPVEENTRLLIHDYLPEEAQMIVYNQDGSKIHREKVTGGENNIYLGHLPTGVYLYEIKDLGVSIYSGKFIKI